MHHPNLSAKQGLSTWWLLSLFLLLTACGNKEINTGEKVTISGRGSFDASAFAAQLKTSLARPPATDSILDTSLSHAMYRCYELHQWQPIWLAENGVLKRAALLVADLDSLYADGLNPVAYNTGWIKEQLEKIKLKQEKLDEAYALRFDTACTRAYLLAARHLLLGCIHPRSVDSLWFHKNDTVWQAFALLGRPGAGYPALDSFRSRLPGYDEMRQSFKKFSLLKKDSLYSALQRAPLTEGNATALISLQMPELAGTDSSAHLIKSYQQWRGIKTTGKLDSATRQTLLYGADSLLALLQINMERMRWMQQNLEQRAILTIIPAMELFLMDKGQLRMHMKTVVGKRSRQTPSLNALMKHVVFNPSWGVPPTILKKDVQSGLGRRGSSYLARKGLHAFTKSGKEVAISNITAANASQFVFRQPPGPRNALGVVKFDMPNKWDIYLHDTPHREDFGRQDRALSSGCIRLERPRDLAVCILQDLEGRNFDLLKIDSITTTRKTKYQKLTQLIIVHVVYLTAFPDSNLQGLRFLPDIYGRDRKLKEILLSKK